MSTKEWMDQETARQLAAREAALAKGWCSETMAKVAEGESVLNWPSRF